MTTLARLHLCGSHDNHDILSYVGKYIANLEKSYRMLLKLQPILLQPCILRKSVSCLSITCLIQSENLILCPKSMTHSFCHV